MLLDIEKISYTVFNNNSSAEDQFTKQFTKNLINENDLAQINRKFKNLEELTQRAEYIDSLFVSENHARLKTAIEDLYSKICDLFNFDFEQKYLSDKARVICSLHNYFVNTKKAA
jgi:hypothetical protein